MAAMVAGKSSLHCFEARTTIKPFFYPMPLPCLPSTHERGMVPSKSISSTRRGSSSTTTLTTGVIFVSGDLALLGIQAADTSSPSIPVFILEVTVMARLLLARLLLFGAPAGDPIDAIQPRQVGGHEIHHAGDGNEVAQSLHRSKLLAADPCGCGRPHQLQFVIQFLVGPRNRRGEARLLRRNRFGHSRRAPPAVLWAPMVQRGGHAGSPVPACFIWVTRMLMERIRVWSLSYIRGFLPTASMWRPPKPHARHTNLCSKLPLVLLGFYAAYVLHFLQVLFHHRHRLWTCKARPPSTGLHSYLLHSHVMLLQHHLSPEILSLEGIGGPPLPQLKVARPFRIGVLQVPCNLGCQPSFYQTLALSLSSVFRICNLPNTFSKCVYVSLLYLN